MPTIKQGEIYDYDFGLPEDNRQAGLRPALVVQTDYLNAPPGYPLTLIVPITTKSRGTSRSHVMILPDKSNGLTATSFAKCEQVFTVQKEDLSWRLGVISQEGMDAVREALRLVFRL